MHTAQYRNVAEHLSERSNGNVNRSWVLLEMPPLSIPERIGAMTSSMKAFGLFFNQSLFLSAPELWDWMGVDDWRELFLRVTPRGSRRYFYDTGEYGDAVFLITALHIDVITMLNDMAQLPAIERIKIAAYLGGAIDLLCSTPQDLKALWHSPQEISWILAMARRRLHAEHPELKLDAIEPDSIRRQCEELIARLGGRDLLYRERQ